MCQTHCVPLALGMAFGDSHVMLSDLHGLVHCYGEVVQPHEMAVHFLAAKILTGSICKA